MSTALRTYYRGDELVGLRDAQAGATRYYHFDHQGTTQCLTDGTGAVTDRFASDAWGVQVKRTGSSINRHWYVGDSGYYNSSSERQYIRQRWLCSQVGRWNSIDIIPDQHPFAYAANSPVRSTDASGWLCNSDGSSCCCEILSADLDVTSIPASDPFRAGHRLILTVKVKNRPPGQGELSSSCFLTWQEKLHEAQSKTIADDEWFNVASHKEIFIDNPTESFEHDLPDCPGESTIKQIDRPGFLKPLKPKDHANQRLCIRIEIYDGCSGKSTIKTFMQRYVITNGKLVTMNPPNMPPWMDRYCQYP